MRACLVVLAALAASAIQAAPPVVTLPAEIRGDVSAFVVVKPSEVKDADAVKFVPLDAGLSVFPGDLLTDKKVTVVVAAKAGRYRLLAYSGNKDGASEPAITTLVIGGATTPPPVDPPKDPPPVTGKKHYMLVRAGGPIPKWIEDAMNLPAWAEVKALGHSVADITLDDVRIPPEVRTKYAGQPTPFMLVWDLVPGKNMLLPDNAPALPFPTTNDAIKGLLK